MIKIVKIQKEGTLEHTRASVCVRACAFGGEQGLMSAPWRLLWGSETVKAAEAPVGAGTSRAGGAAESPV